MTTHDNSAVTFVDNVLQKAIQQQVSDIHIEPTASAVRIRFRIDGILIDQESLPHHMASQIVARCKVLAHMNSTQKRIPQDGKLRLLHNGKPVDVRVSTFPNVHGEKVVLRILDTSKNSMHIADLGFAPSMINRFKQLIDRSSGFLLVTGPTGSGKTTTLYAALAALHRPEYNIVTLEDPVEYSINGVNQAQINSDIGFSFADGMRSVLRQDPDIIMIGEIRDKETARTAIDAAMTGHLVLSTLHTNDAPSAVMRLMDMGIEPYLINASLTGVLAQRLIRLLCAACKTKREPNAQEQATLARLHITISHLFFPVGCPLCYQIGYKGRIGIFELLELSADIKQFIVHAPKMSDMYAQAHREGMQTLVQDAAIKLRQGLISLEEMLRVV